MERRFIMATLYERDGKFYVNYTIHGKRVRRSIGTNKHVAETYLKELQYRLFKGDIKPERPRIPIEYVISRYLENCKSRIASSTHRRYQNAITHFEEFITKCSPVKYVDQITKIMLSDYVSFRKQGKKPKGKTINNELAVIRAMLSFAVDSDYIEKNPASKIKMQKTNDSKKGRVITEDEVALLLDGCKKLKDGPWFREILLVFLNTGMRLGELLNLTWDDIAPEGLIRIQEKPNWSPKSYERNIPINPITRSILKRLREHQKGKYVFTWRGSQIENNKLRKKLITLSRKVGLPHITRIHDLRHTFASNLLMKGVDIPTVQALLGHRSWNTTLVYSHQTKEHTREAVSRL
jgi:site-specific recombinase XerD